MTSFYKAKINKLQWYKFLCIVVVVIGFIFVRKAGWQEVIPWAVIATVSYFAGCFDAEIANEKKKEMHSYLSVLQNCDKEKSL